MTALKLDHRFGIVTTDHGVFGFPPNSQCCSFTGLVTSATVTSLSLPTELSLLGSPQEAINHELGDIYLVVQKPPELYAAFLVSRTSNRWRILRRQHLQRVHPVADSTLPTPPARPPVESCVPISFSSFPDPHTLLLFSIGQASIERLVSQQCLVSIVS